MSAPPVPASNAFPMLKAASTPEELENSLGTMEKLLLQTIFAAVKEGDIDSVKEMLEILSDNPQSLQAVMYALTTRLSNLNISCGIETVAQTAGKFEVRMHLGGDLGGGWGSICLSSTGKHSAQVWGYKDLCGRDSDAKTTFSTLMIWANLQ